MAIVYGIPYVVTRQAPKSSNRRTTKNTKNDHEVISKLNVWYELDEIAMGGEGGYSGPLTLRAYASSTPN